MLFMGEEYGEDTPFYYFVSHYDAELVEAVRKGRKEEFKDFGFTIEPPDAQDEKTFKDSRLHWDKRNQGKHKTLLHWHRELIGLRQTLPALKNFDKKDIQVQLLGEDGFVLLRQSGDEKQQVLCLFNLSEKQLSYQVPMWMKTGRKILDSKEDKWIADVVEEKEVVPAEIETDQIISLMPLNVVVYCSL
jgi:maltooligosyltrehalose trehalohydrolase